jgi:antitoxin MazE
MMRTRVGRWGNSLAVRIPQSFAKKLGLEDGVELEVSVEQGAMLIRPSRRRYTLEELVSRITPENVHGETDWGPALGRESW